MQNSPNAGDSKRLLSVQDSGLFPNWQFTSLTTIGQAAWHEQEQTGRAIQRWSKRESVRLSSGISFKEKSAYADVTDGDA
jgi:hypothetical protein